MLFQQGVDFLPQRLDQIAPWETRLLLVVFSAFLARHAHALLCATLSIPENWPRRTYLLLRRWIRLLLRMLKRRP